MKVEDTLNAIEKELAEINAALSPSRPPRVVRPKGFRKGLKVDEADRARAKKSLFKHAWTAQSRWDGFGGRIDSVNGEHVAVYYAHR